MNNLNNFILPKSLFKEQDIEGLSKLPENFIIQDIKLHDVSLPRLTIDYGLLYRLDRADFYFISPIIKVKECKDGNFKLTYFDLKETWFNNRPPVYQQTTIKDLLETITIDSMQEASIKIDGRMILKMAILYYEVKGIKSNG